jgi:hypothetical protein
MRAPTPGPDTGVRQPTKTDAMERLEFSREWLKAYHAKKDAAHARGSSSDQEQQTDGRTGNDQGRTNAEYVKSVFDGPTAERLAKAQSHYTVGDDKQGTRIYHFHDTTIDRLYSRLARGREATGSVRAEYVALQKYRLHWHRAGLECRLAA